QLPASVPSENAVANLREECRKRNKPPARGSLATSLSAQISLPVMDQPGRASGEDAHGRDAPEYVGIAAVSSCQFRASRKILSRALAGRTLCRPQERRASSATQCRRSALAHALPTRRR